MSYCLNLTALAVIAWGATSKNWICQEKKNFFIIFQIFSFFFFFNSPTIQFLWLYQYIANKIHTGRHDWRKLVALCHCFIS
jgi:hypothetical protein